MSDSHSTSESILRELTQLRARTQIAELCSEYCYCCDNSDLAGLVSLFTEHATVEIPSFGATASGRSAIEELYRAQLGTITLSNHWTHDLVVKFSAGGTANGRVAAHAEVAIGGTVFAVAILYEDEYEAVVGRWLIGSRRILFMYYTPVGEFASRFGARERIWTAAGWVKGDYPRLRET